MSEVFDTDSEVPDSERADTAGQHDHSDPWMYAGDDVDAPGDTGKPAEEVH